MSDKYQGSVSTKTTSDILKKKKRENQQFPNLKNGVMER